MVAGPFPRETKLLVLMSPNGKLTPARKSHVRDTGITLSPVTAKSPGAALRRPAQGSERREGGSVVDAQPNEKGGSERRGGSRVQVETHCALRDVMPVPAGWRRCGSGHADASGGEEATFAARFWGDG